jgi:hypothetical protein
MKFVSVIFTVVALLLENQPGFAQGFVNLDFESANLTGLPTGSVPAANAFPGWTVNAQYIIYDDVSLSGNSISIMDANGYPPFPIQGNYFAFLNSGNTPGMGIPVSLGQSGTIPLGTQSITFWGNIGGLQITFAGQSLAFSKTGSMAHYNIYAADISAFAGQTGQLLFSLPPYVNSATLDNVQFSSSSVPEPSQLALTALGAVLLGFRRRLRHR